MKMKKLAISALSATMLFSGASSVFANSKTYDEQTGIETVIIDVPRTSDASLQSNISPALNGGIVTPMALTTTNATFLQTVGTGFTETSQASAASNIKMYKEDVNDPNYSYYIFWHSGTATSKTNTAGVDNGNIRYLGLRTIFAGDIFDFLITGWAPITDTTVNTPQTINVELGYSKGGVSGKISSSFVLSRDVFGPEAINPSSKAGVRWSGNYEGSQGIEGGVEFRAPASVGWVFVRDHVTHQIELKSSQI